jgi:hypothetical protein
MRFLLRTLPLVLLGCAALAVPAHAASTQEVTFEAPRDLHDAARRDAAFAELDSLGVRALRVVLYWRDVAPAAKSRVKPKFDATNPAAYNWGKYDPVLAGAKARGWTVQLTVSGPVPRWGTNGAKDQVTNPRSKEFALFMTAVARHYGDSVARWSIWNEPNHPAFLRPQFRSKRRPASPSVYRSLYAAALRGLKAAGDTKPVLMGETAPMGTRRDVAPLAFLRGALCLNSRYKRTGKCKKLRVDGFAHHAYTTRKGPLYRPSGADNVTIGVLSRLTRALDRAARARVVARRLPVYLTEFGIQSMPDPLYGVSLQRQAEYRSIAERIAYSNSRVRAFSQYLLRDDAPVAHVSRLARYGGFESGLRTSSGRAKPALAGFRLPVAAYRRGSKVSLWGIVRPASGATTAVLQQRDGRKGWSKLATIRTGARGAWARTARYREGRAWRVLWTAPSGKTYTAPATRAYRR